MLDTKDLIQLFVYFLSMGAIVVTGGIAWGRILARLDEGDTKMIELADKQKESDGVREGLKREYLTTKEHSLLCENVAMKIVNKINELFAPKFEQIEESIQSNREMVLEEIGRWYKTNGYTRK